MIITFRTDIPIAVDYAIAFAREYPVSQLAQSLGLLGAFICGKTMSATANLKNIFNKQYYLLYNFQFIKAVAPK